MRNRLKAAWWCLLGKSVCYRMNISGSLKMDAREMLVVETTITGNGHGLGIKG